MSLSQTDYQASRQMQKLARRVQRDLKKASGRDGLGFMLIVFQTDDDSRTSYISNCDRKEVIEAIKALLQRWGEGMPDIPAHEIN